MKVSARISPEGKKEKPWFLKALKAERNPFFDKIVRKTGFIQFYVSARKVNSLYLSDRSGVFTYESSARQFKLLHLRKYAQFFRDIAIRDNKMWFPACINTLFQYVPDTLFQLYDNAGPHKLFGCIENFTFLNIHPKMPIRFSSDPKDGRVRRWLTAKVQCRADASVAM